tara:strand:+ start:947 stop:1846 length:900 start_codon:yes stop_codon:yes gene_type:complete
MKSTRFIAPIIILFIVVSSCEIENNAVEILSFEASDSFGLAGDTIMLYCIAEDGDGDKLGYSWETSSGIFSTKSDSTEWIPPFIEGTFLVTCKVSDGVGSSDARTIPISIELPTPVPVNGLSWTLTDSGLLGGPNSSNDNNTGLTGYWDGTVEGADYGWNVTEKDTPNREVIQSLQFKVEDSQDCGGENPNTQEGTATANIQITGSSPVNLDIDFSGIGEAQSAGYDLIKFILNGEVIGDGQAPGGGLGCVSDSVLVNPADQQILEPGSHTLVIDFTTNDGMYHVDAYYEIELKLMVQE